MTDECSSLEDEISSNISERLQGLHINCDNLFPSPNSPPLSISPTCFDSDDIELKNFSNIKTDDELPIFTIRSLSPSGESISPIDNDNVSSFSDGMESPCFNMAVSPDPTNAEDGSFNNFVDVMTLDEINEQISTPPSSGRYSSKQLYLETIFEGVLLDTPPKSLARRLRKILIES